MIRARRLLLEVMRDKAILAVIEHETQDTAFAQA